MELPGLGQLQILSRPSRIKVWACFPKNFQIEDTALLPIAEKVLAGERLNFRGGGGALPVP